jgi:hypothetical protein
MEERYRLGGEGRPEMTEEQRARARGADLRNSGLRRVRRMSNWTAAALLVATGGATAALASQALSTSGATGATSYGAAGTTAQGSTAPHVAGSVVTSGGSGATVTTNTRVVNGKTVVTQVRHPAVYHDY